MIGDSEVSVQWEDNESVAALRELVADGPLTVAMSSYGGFEQVGSLGTSLPRNDVQITTQAGDIVLYSGNNIVIFYGSNSWAYTRLGHIELSSSEMPDADAELPYEGAKEMLLVNDVDNREFLRELLDAMYNELPAPKKKK
ncbi:MAG: hypothetical protein IJT42_04555 [Treponema sp.]|nr:hypothetical protein [Treponema sp.]